MSDIVAKGVLNPAMSDNLYIGGVFLIEADWVIQITLSSTWLPL